MRVTSSTGFSNLGARSRGQPDRRGFRHIVRIRSSIRRSRAGPSSRGRTEDRLPGASRRRPGSRGVKRHGPDPVGADRVRECPVGRDPIGPDEDDVDLAACHQVSDGHVGDERVGDVRLGELPRVSRVPWQIRSGLVDPDVVPRRPARWAAWTTPSAVPSWPQASGPVLPWAARGAPSLGSGQDLEPDRREPARSVVASNTICIRLGAPRIGDRVAVVGQLVELLVPGDEPIRRPEAG